MQELDVSKLRDEFNLTSDSVRFVTLLSPT